MEVKTFSDLISWTRQLHEHLAIRLKQGSSQNAGVRASALLQYLSEHEAHMERLVREFERQADPKAMKTYVYDYIAHKPIKRYRTADDHYALLSFDEICREVFDFHTQVIELYRVLMGKVDIPEVQSLLEPLIEMEEHEAMQLSMQTGRMADM